MCCLLFICPWCHVVISHTLWDDFFGCLDDSVVIIFDSIINVTYLTVSGPVSSLVRVLNSPHCAFYNSILLEIVASTRWWFFILAVLCLSADFPVDVISAVYHVWWWYVPAVWVGWCLWEDFLSHQASSHDYSVVFPTGRLFSITAFSYNRYYLYSVKC